MERLKEEARTHGFVRTPFGRKLWIPDIATRDPVRRAGAERAAINAPFQGGAAEIIKRAMVRLPRALRDAGLKGRMLLQVHDELVFEVPEAEVEATERARAANHGIRSPHCACRFRLKSGRAIPGQRRIDHGIGLECS
jgi:DNA polymerase-1